MRKILSIFFCVLLLFSLVSCVEEDTPKKETAQTSSSSSAGEEKFGLNETAVFKDLKFTATELKESKGKDFFEPEEGKVFVGVKFTIENVSEEEQSVSSLLLFEAYADDIKTDMSFNASGVFSEGTLDGEVAPGKKLVGWYAVEVPENWTEIEIDIKADWLSDSSAQFVFTK